MTAKYVFLIIPMAILITLSFAASNAADKWQLPSESVPNLPNSPVSKPESFLTILGKAVYYVYIAFFIVAVLFIVLAAYDYLTKSGEPEKIKEVHRKLLYAVIAIVVALLAVGAEEIIQQFLEKEGGGGGGVWRGGSVGGYYWDEKSKTWRGGEVESYWLDTKEGVGEIYKGN